MNVIDNDDDDNDSHCRLCLYYEFPFWLLFSRTHFFPCKYFFLFRILVNIYDVWLVLIVIVTEKKKILFLA